MKITVLIFLALFLFSGSIYSQTTTPESDFQIWNETQIVVPLVKTRDKKTDKVSLILYGTLRAGRNLRHFIDERFGLGFEYKVNRFLSFSISYIYRAGQPLEGRKEYENRFRFDAGMEKKFKNFSIKDRHRLEYRVRNSRSDSVRYRNKFQLTIPLTKAGKEILAPFIADEPYYDFREKAWSRNEFSVGINRKFNKTISADFFYLLQNNRGNVLKYVNAVGVNLKFKFD